MAVYHEQVPTHFDKCSSLLPLCQHCSASLSFQAVSPFHMQNSRGRGHRLWPIYNIKEIFFMVCLLMILKSFMLGKIFRYMVCGPVFNI